MRVLLGSRHSSADEWARSLARAGFAVDRAADQLEIDTLRGDEPFDALVVDYDFVDADLRAADPHDAGLIILTDVGDLDQRIDALRSRCDDVVASDIGARELVLRVALVLLRIGHSESARRVELGEVMYDRVTRRIWRSGEPIHLSPTALCIFDHLVAHRNRLVPEAELLDHCWNIDRDLFSNPLASQLHRLRRTFEGSLRFSLLPDRGYRIEAISDEAKPN